MAKNKKAAKLTGFSVYPISNIMYTVALMRFISILIFFTEPDQTPMGKDKYRCNIFKGTRFYRQYSESEKVEAYFWAPRTCMGFRTRF
jgi:hypothetical protein